MKLTNNQKTISCSSNWMTSQRETRSRAYQSNWKCTNEGNKPNAFKEKWLFGPGMNVEIHNFQRGNLSDDGLDIHIRYKHYSEDEKKMNKKDFNMNFKEFKDYCVRYFTN